MTDDNSSYLVITIQQSTVNMIIARRGGHQFIILCSPVLNAGRLIKIAPSVYRLHVYTGSTSTPQAFICYRRVYTGLV